MYTPVVLLLACLLSATRLALAQVSVVGAQNSLGDSQAVAWTTTWPANPDSNPLTKMCIQTHVNLPIYTFFVTAMSALGDVIWDSGKPQSTHNTTCSDLGFKDLGFDEKTCASDPDCKHIAPLLADVTVWIVDAETLGKIAAQPDVIVPTREEGRSASQTLDVNSDARSQAVAWTATWPANPDSNPLAKMCIQTHANLPMFTFFVTAMSALGDVVWDSGKPQSTHNTTCSGLGFKELGFDEKTCASDPDCKPIAPLLADVTVWLVDTETLNASHGAADFQNPAVSKCDDKCRNLCCKYGESSDCLTTCGCPWYSCPKLDDTKLFVV